MTPDEAVSTEKLVQDLKLVIGDAEDLLRATAAHAGEKVAVAREKFEHNLRRARLRLAEMEDAARDAGRDVARATDEFVREKPWQAVGIAAAAGLILGLL